MPTKKGRKGIGAIRSADEFVLFFPQDWTHRTTIRKAIDYGSLGYIHMHFINTGGDFECAVLTTRKITRAMAQLHYDSLMNPDTQDYEAKAS